MKTIVVIGGGFSGMMATLHLLRHTTTSLQVLLVEPREILGAGVAYSTTQPEHLLNVAVKNMSAFPGDALHFHRWLGASGLAATPDDYVPRMYYRVYLQAIFQEFIDDLHGHIRFEHVVDYATALEVQPDYAVVKLRSGMKLYADAVILALGNLPPRNPSIADPTFYQQSTRYIENGWSTDALDGLKADDNVLLIGTGLTMIDYVLTLRERGHEGNIFALSRHGLLPLAHLSHPVDAYPFQLDELPREPYRLLRYVREQVEAVMADGGEWHSVINGLRPLVNDIWRRASEAQRCRFMRHLLPYWNIYRHRIPAQVAEKVDQLLESGQLTVLAGCIEAFEEYSEGVDVYIRLRGTTERELVVAQRVINCTGANSDYRTVEQPLIKQIMIEGLGRPGALNIGFDVDPHGALIDHDGHTSQVVFTLGPSRRGQRFENIAVPELREQAYMLAQHVLTSLASRENHLPITVEAGELILNTPKT